MKFKRRRTRGYPKTIVERSFSGANFVSRQSALTQKEKANERILPFVTFYHSALTDIDGTMGSHTKSASAENYLFETPDNNIQKR